MTNPSRKSAALQATPASKPKGKKFSQLLPLLIGAVVGGFIGYLGSDFIERVLDDSTSSQKLLAIAMLPVVYFLAIAVHEGGHLLGGKLMGFRFLFVYLGPLAITRQTSGVKLRLSWNSFTFGGMAGTFPTDNHQYSRRTAAMIALGPVASLLLSLLMGSLFIAGTSAETLKIMSFEQRFAFFIAGSTAAISFLLFMASIIPLKTGGLTTDGGRLLRLLRGGKQIERESALLAIHADSLTGKRPRYWNSTWIQTLLTNPDGSAFDVSGNWYAFYKELDRGNYDRAQTYLDAALSLLPEMPKLQQPALMFEAAYFYAFHKQNVEVARQWLQRAKQDKLNPTIQLRAEAAVYFAEQKFDQARKKVQQGLAKLKQSVDGGMAAAEKEWLQEIGVRVS